MRNTLYVFIISVVIELIFIPSEKSFCTHKDYKQCCRETIKLDWVERKGYWKSNCQGCGGVGVGVVKQGRAMTEKQADFLQQSLGWGSELIQAVHIDWELGALA